MLVHILAITGLAAACALWVAIQRKADPNGDGTGSGCGACGCGSHGRCERKAKPSE
jgi:hypothetical protein